MAKLCCPYYFWLLHIIGPQNMLSKEIHRYRPQWLGPIVLFECPFSLADLQFHYLIYFVFADWRWPTCQLFLACYIKHLLIMSHTGLNFHNVRSCFSSLAFTWHSLSFIRFLKISEKYVSLVLRTYFQWPESFIA